MEAEAQCAELVRLGLVDGVVTDDCDIFLFGGTRVYKNMFNSNKFVECYLSSDIEKELSLSRDQLIFLAHLLGSDYTEGLPGIGPVTAVEILSEFPSPKTGLQEFKDWWSTIQLNNANPKSSELTPFRKKFRRSQATKLFLPPGFPSPAVTEAYLKPEVDSTPEPFQWGVPDLDSLREFLMATIGWTQERTDEVLVPVIRDMNRREQEGTQSNITRFFEGSVGAGAGGVVGKERAVGSKRMKDAMNRLKAKDRGNGGGALSKTFADEAMEWAKHNDIGWTEREQEKARKKSGKGKGKGKRGEKRKAPAVDTVEDEEQGDDGVDGADEESDSGEEYRDTPASRSKGKGDSKGKANVKRKRKF
jgi:DNA excision repair protein ERCC-5